jgi:hypothetical protein
LKTKAEMENQKSNKTGENKQWKLKLNFQILTCGGQVSYNESNKC